MDGEGMQVSSTIHFEGIEKGIRWQGLINILW